MSLVSDKTSAFLFLTWEVRGRGRQQTKTGVRSRFLVKCTWQPSLSSSFPLSLSFSYYFLHKETKTQGGTGLLWGSKSGCQSEDCHSGLLALRLAFSPETTKFLLAYTLSPTAPVHPTLLQQGVLQTGGRSAWLIFPSLPPDLKCPVNAVVNSVAAGHWASAAKLQVSTGPRAFYF